MHARGAFMVAAFVFSGALAAFAPASRPAVCASDNGLDRVRGTVSWSRSETGSRAPVSTRVVLPADAFVHTGAASPPDRPPR
jgi:hypothetical protein